MTKYGSWFGLNGVPWCGIFVSWVYATAGMHLPKIGFSKGFAGCQTAMKYFKEKGLVTDNPIPGDIVFFDWNSDGRYDHTGIFVKRRDAAHFESIEGNTGWSSDSNGGEVMRRSRKYASAVFVHPIENQG
jgi:cell wall-associated NlpC family hydrolase